MRSGRLLARARSWSGQRVTLENRIRGAGGRVRDPSASRAHRSIHRSRLSRRARGLLVFLPPCGSLSAARTTAADDCGGRDRHADIQTYDKGLRGLPSADDHPRRRPTDRARLPSPQSMIPWRIRRSRDIGASFGLVPRRYQSGEVDYTGNSISGKCGDGRGCEPFCTKPPMSC